MANQSESPTHEPVTLRGSVGNLSYLTAKLYIPYREGGWGMKKKIPQTNSERLHSNVQFQKLSIPPPLPHRRFSCFVPSPPPPPPPKEVSVQLHTLLLNFWLLIAGKAVFPEIFGGFPCIKLCRWTADQPLAQL